MEMIAPHPPSAQQFANQMRSHVQEELMRMDARNLMYVLNKKEISMEICAQPIAQESVTKAKFYVKDTLMIEDV